MLQVCSDCQTNAVPAPRHFHRSGDLSHDELSLDAFASFGRDSSPQFHFADDPLEEATPHNEKLNPPPPPWTVPGNIKQQPNDF